MDDSEILNTLDNDEDIELESEIGDDELDNEFDDNLIYSDKSEPNSEEDIIINKNNIIIIDNDKRKSLPILTKYEITRIISIRSSQIENGAEACIIVDSKNNNPINVAKMELLMGESPLILRRKIYSNYYEEWKIKELKIINKELINKLIF